MNRECIYKKFKTKPTKKSGVLNYCSRLGKYEEPKFITEGTEGRIYKSRIKGIKYRTRTRTKFLSSLDRNDVLDVVIKVEKLESKFMRRLKQEIKLGVYLGKYNIGPKIYDYFYVTKNDRIYQYIIMESFDGSLNKLISNKNVSIDTKSDAILKMIDLLYIMMIGKKIFCIDTKLNNCVYKYDEKGELVVRLIDFGNDMCFPEPFRNNPFKNKKYNEYMFFYLALIQNAYFIYRLTEKKERVSLINVFYREFPGFRDFTKKYDILDFIGRNQDEEFMTTFGWYIKNIPGFINFLKKN